MASGSVSTQPADRELLRRIRHGEESAWSALLDRYERLIYAIPPRFGLLEPDRSAAFARVCRALLDGIDDLADTRCLASWLVSTASRISRDRRRTSPRLAGTEPAPALSGDEVRALRDRGMVRSALDRVPSRCRTAIEAAWLAAPSLPWAAIVRDLGLTEGRSCLSELSRVLAEVGFED